MKGVRTTVLVGALAVLTSCLAPFLRRCWRLPQVLVAPADKAPDALRVGLMGASFIGQVAAVYAAGKRRDVVVTAVASRDAARAEAFARRHGIPVALGGPGAYDDLLKRSDVDAVYISLPTTLHVRWAAAALAANKHVLLEKPAAANLQEALELSQLAARPGPVLMEAAHYRHHPAALRSRSLMQERLGPLQRLEARFFMLDPKAWLASGSPDPSGREHERVKNFDRWWYCADELLWMSGATSWSVRSAVEGHFSIEAELLLTLPSSPLAQVNATIRMSRDKLWPLFDWSFHAEGSEGRLAYSNIGFPFLFHSLSVEMFGSQAQRWDERLYGEGETTFEHQLAAFVSSVRGGQSAAAAEQALRTMRLVDDILKAAGSQPLLSGASA